MKPSFLERLVGGLAHLIALSGALHFAMLLITFPVFPKITLYWLIPNVVLSLVALKWSRYILTHTVQAFFVQIAVFGMALIPWFIRVLNAAGLLNERWFYTGWEGYRTTPAWGLMTLIVGLSTIMLFGVTGDAAVKGFTGSRFEYPIIWRLTRRIPD